MPEWLKGADCKSAGLRLRWFETISAHYQKDTLRAGVAQLVEHHPSKVNVERSSRFTRSTTCLLGFVPRWLSGRALPW